MPDGLHAHVIQQANEEFVRKEKQEKLKTHILLELNELKNFVKKYKTTVQQNPNKNLDNHIIYLEKTLDRIIHSVKKNY